MQLEPAEAARRVLAQDDADPEVWKALRQGSDHNGQSYYLLLYAMGRRNTLRNVPALLVTVMKEGSWQRWRWVGQEFVAHTFGEYVTRAPPAGLGATLIIVEKLIADDPEALALFRKLTTKPLGTNQHTVSEGTDIVSTQPEHGNSRAYTLDRLKRKRPDLYAEVVAGRLTANAAAIEAGFRKHTIAVPADPEAAIAALVRKFGFGHVCAALHKLAKDRAA